MSKSKILTVKVEGFGGGHLYSYHYDNRQLESIYSDNVFCRGYLNHLMRFMREGDFTHYKLIDRGSEEVVYSESFNSLFNRVYK